MPEYELCTLRPVNSTDYLPINAKDMHHFWPKQWWRRMIERAAWAVLVRLGARFDRPIEKIDYKRVRIDGDTLLRKMTLGQREIYRIWNREIKYVVVGHQTAEKLLDEIAGQSFYQFETSVKLAYGSHRNFRVIGLTVVVVPWLEAGVILLPELQEKPDRLSSEFSASYGLGG